MTPPKFLIAKYAPDLHRMEPRNFGVIAWSDGHMAARFLGELPGGKVKPPHMVARDARDAYRQWIDYWRLQMSKPCLELRGGGTVARERPEFLEAIKAKSKPHFMLVEAGALLEPVPAEELPAVVGELFGSLVEPPAAPDRGHAESELLRASATDFFVKTQLASRPDFHTHFPQVCRVHGILREIHFDNAVGDVGRPLAVFQRVLLLKEQSVGNALHMLDWYGKMSAAPPQSRRFALIHSAAVGGAEPIAANLSILNAVATVINLADPEEAQHRFAVASAGM
ncbi:MAG: hypothetical protein ACREHD_09770 [Pirellulales bacterium]